MRFSFNRAFRAPSLINNFLDVNIVNQLDLRAINPAFAAAPGGPVYNFPVQRHAATRSWWSSRSTRSRRPTPASINKRATVTAAFYYNKSKDDIFFTQVGRYRAAQPAARLAGQARRRSWAPPQALGILEVLPPSCVAARRRRATAAASRRQFSYRNLGTVKDKGFELGVDAAVNRALNVFANYSYQFKPDPDFDISEVNLPPTNRVNAGFNFSQGMFLGNMNVSYQDSAFWQDVLDSRFHGSTDVVHAGQRRVRREVAGRQDHDHDQVQQPVQRGDPVAHLRRHPPAAGDRRVAGAVLGATAEPPAAVRSARVRRASQSPSCCLVGRPQVADLSEPARARWRW